MRLKKAPGKIRMPFYHFKEQLFFEITDVGMTRFEPSTLPTKVGMRFNAKHKKTPLCRGVLCFVGKTGFEPATPWSQTRCATGLRYFPILNAVL